jgi:hypothetical protein
MISVRLASVVVLVAASSRGGAQTLPAVHPLGPVLATSTEPLAAVSQVRALPGGRVIVNDNTGRRVVLFDSTFKTVTVIADSTSATATAYGSRIGGLIAFRGDSTLFVDPASLSMLVIDADGRIVRTMAAPRPSDIQGLIGGPFGTPGFDAQGRLVYRALIRVPPIVIRSAGSGPSQLPPRPDSSLIVRFDLTSRTLDTVAKFGIPQIQMAFVTIQVSGRDVSGSTSVVNPIPWTDDWAVLSDGTIAIVRGREYRVDFVDANDKMASAPKLAFDWLRLTDEDKAAIIDSTKAALEQQRAAQFALRTAALATAAQRDSSAKPGQSRATPAPPAMPPLLFAAINEMPDYRPAFRQGAARGDADGHLWIRTSKMVNGGAVYDVISRQGVLIDRIQVPAGRVIAGFGPGGVVYMGVVDGTITRLERARAVIAGR